FVREIRLGYNQENAYFMIPLLTIIYFLMSYCISIILSKIPLLRKVI
ncbi:acyltransferase, partial [Escherichia coli]|nr:acyltransferase [Escherichia coli]